MPAERKEYPMTTETTETSNADTRIDAIMASVDRDSDSADKAKALRRVLKLRFPATRFSVRTHRYSMGSSVRVSWDDGPTARIVETYCKRLDRVYRDDATGDILGGGNAFVFAQRDVSPELRAAARAFAQSRYDYDERQPYEQDALVSAILERRAENMPILPDGPLTPSETPEAVS